MHTVARRILLVGLLALAGSLVVAADAAAEGREFTGTVQSIQGGGITVESRRGDARSFVPASGVTVQGTKSAWGDIRKGDRVTVSWKIADTPAKAYKVVVRPPRK